MRSQACEEQTALDGDSFARLRLELATSLVEHYVRDVGAGGSNPLTPTIIPPPRGIGATEPTWASRPQQWRQGSGASGCVTTSAKMRPLHDRDA